VAGIEHELPCGHKLSTELLLDRLTRFDGWELRGAVCCPECESQSITSFRREAISNGSNVWDVTFVSTGLFDGAPEGVFMVHERRRVPGLTVDGTTARLGLREWKLPE
jgi:hypothetical protein